MCRIHTIIFSLLLALPFTANAQYGNHKDYVGGGLVRSNLSFVNEDFDLNALELRMGVEMQKWLHIEGRVAFGINDKATTSFFGPVEVSINRLINVNAVVGWPNDSLFRPYVVAGVTYGELQLRIPGLGRGDESETDISLGAGVNFSISDSLDLYVEYMNYMQTDDFDLDGIGIGLKFDF